MQWGNLGIPIDEPLVEVSKRIDEAESNGDLESLAAISEHLKRRPEPKARTLIIKVASAARKLRASPTASTKPAGVSPLVAKPKINAVLPASAQRSQSKPIPNGPWAELLKRAGVASPDGRALHRYHLGADGMKWLRESMRARWPDGFPGGNREAAALFVIWAAHWFQCEYGGGIMRWEDLGSALGVPFAGDDGRRLAREGLRAWGRDPVISESAEHSFKRSMWLRTLAVEGGFPAALLKDVDKWAGRYLERVVGSLLTEPSLEPEIAFTIAESYGDSVPRSFRQEIFYALAADLAIQVVRLRREIEQDSRSRGVPVSAWLDVTRPGWRAELPVAAGTEGADRLVDGLMRTEAIKAARGGGIGCDRILVRRKGEWVQAVRLGLDGVAAGDLAARLAGRDDRLRVHPSGGFGRYVSGELAMVEPPVEKGDGWRVRPSRPGAEFLTVPFTTPVTVELRANGVPQVLVQWPGGEPVREEIGVYSPEGDIERDGGTLRLVGTGSGGYRPETLFVCVPDGWKVSPLGEASTAALVDATVTEGGRLWNVVGTAIVSSPDGEAYRISGGQTADMKDRLRLVGSWPRGIECEEPDVELLADLKDVRLCEGNAERAPKSGEVQWRPDGGRGWLPFVTRPERGRFDIAWKDSSSGFVVDRRRVFVTGGGTSVEAKRVGDSAEYRIEGIPADSLKPNDDDLVVEHGDGMLVARFCNRPSRRAQFLLHVGDGRPLRVSAGFPLGSGIANWSGTVIRGGTGSGARVTLTELSDCVAFSEGKQVLIAKLHGRYGVALKGGTATWLFHDELPLRGVASDLSALLLPFADIDVSADISFVGGREHWRVHQFDTSLTVLNGEIIGIDGLPGDETVVVCGRAIRDPSVEIDFGASTAEDRIAGRVPTIHDLKGAWLLYLRRGEDVISRPTITTFGMDAEERPAGLAGAVLIADATEREAAILSCLDVIASDAPDADGLVDWLMTLCADLRGLPPGSLDALRLTSYSPGVLARVALRASMQGPEQREAVLGLVHALPFAWPMVPYDCWAKAGQTERTSLVAKLRDILGDRADGIADQAIGDASTKIAEDEDLLRWPLFAAGLLSPAQLPRDRRPLADAVQDHLRRYADQVHDDPNATSMFRIGSATSILPDFSKFHPSFWETLDAPLAAAAVAAGRLTLDLDSIRRIKTALRQDPVYFTEAFNAYFVDLLNRKQ